MSSEEKTVTASTDTKIILSVTTDTVVNPAATSEVKSEPAPAPVVVSKKKSDKKSGEKSNKKDAKKNLKKDTSVKENGGEKKSKFKVSKKDEKKDKPVEPSLRDIMFPAKFTVHGVTFTRIEDSDIEKANKKLKDDEKIESLVDYVSYLFNKDKAVMIGANWEKEMLNPKGKKKSSEYQISTGIVPPSEFPANVEMCLIDVILNIQFEAFVSHSIYTEFPGTTPFEVFKKRDKKHNYFVSDGGVPIELYVADYSKANDNVIGSFINLYEDGDGDKDESAKG